MPTFIKPGFWEKTKKGYANWLNLDQLITNIVTALIPPVPEPIYKVYTALLTQSGTNAPVPTVLENTLVGTVSFYYDGVGSFVIVSSEGWDETKTTFQLEASNGFDLVSGLFPSYIPIIGGGKGINTFTNVGTAGSQPPRILPQSNGVLTNSLIEIRVYN